MSYRMKATAGIIAIALFCAGCGDAIPEMTEQQTEMVTEYAANTMLVHVPESSGGSRLVDTTMEFDPSKMSKFEKMQRGLPIEDMTTPQTPEPDEQSQEAPADETQEAAEEDAG